MDVCTTQSRSNSSLACPEVQDSKQDLSANLIATGNAARRQPKPFYTLIECTLWLAAIVGWCVIVYLYHLNP